MKQFSIAIGGMLLLCLMTCAGVGVAINQATAYRQSTSDYVLSMAAANAVYADTKAAHGFDLRWWSFVGALVCVVVVLVGLFAVIQERQQRRLWQLLAQTPTLPPTTEPPACLPNPVYTIESAPERENTYLSVWAGK